MERQSAKQKGMFSRRHQTAAACLKSKEVKLNRIDEQFRASVQRDLERKKRTPQQQLTLLDGRLGEGIGATKERKRLHGQINTVEEAKKQPDDSPKPKKKRKSNQYHQRS